MSSWCGEAPTYLKTYWAGFLHPSREKSESLCSSLLSPKTLLGQCLSPFSLHLLKHHIHLDAEIFNPLLIFTLTNGVLWPRLIDFITRAPCSPSHWGPCWFGGECWDVATEGGGVRGEGRWPADDLSVPPLWNIAQVQKHISASWRDSTNLKPSQPHPTVSVVWVCARVCARWVVASLCLPPPPPPFLHYNLIIILPL